MTVNNKIVDRSPESSRRPVSTLSAAKRLRSEELFHGTGEVVIVHDGREYRLRVTRNGKLILTA